MPTWQHFLALLAPRVWPLEKSLGASKTETQTLVERSNFFLIKYSKFDKITVIIYFNELLSSPLDMKRIVICSSYVHRYVNTKAALLCECLNRYFDFHF